ncbi:MAG TPA: Holliday junction resolvase RuvX [Acidimicrobiia bacterium]|nr:Holliday junction resolvase RuvX [Acidimicrobiia bacterium]
MSRVLGVDLGSRRIGLAATDESNTLASPFAVLERGDDPADDYRAILDAAREIGAARIVVGLPLSLDGSQGPAAQSVLAEVGTLKWLARPERIAVDTYDERFSTVVAEQGLFQANVRRSKRRRMVDAAAATVILQSWLEANG